MDCHEVSDLLSAYIDGELELDESRGITNHLSVCARCRKELFELQQTIDLLHALPDLTPPPDLCLRVMNRLKAESKKKAWFSFKSRPWVSLGAVAAAVLLFVASINVISPFRTLPVATESSTRMAADSLDAPKDTLAETELYQLDIYNTTDDAIDTRNLKKDISNSDEQIEVSPEDLEKQLMKTKQENDLLQEYSLSAETDAAKIFQNNEVNSTSQETNINMAEYNGEKELKNRSSNYRGREESQVLINQTGEGVEGTGLEYDILLKTEDTDQISQEICQIVYSLGGNVLSQDLTGLEVAVPTTRLEVAFAAFNDKGIAEVHQVSSQDVNQVIGFLKQKQEELLLNIKELERQTSQVLPEERLANLEVTINQLYKELKITQLKLKTIANGNTIVKINFQ